MKVLDIILEKGKGPILGKLRIIQLIEADMQSIIRIFVGDRNNENTETDERLSQYNYGSQKNYSINIAILEKRLMCNVLIRNRQTSIHNISDLKAYYNR